MPGIAYTLSIGLVPAPPTVVEAVQEIEVDASTEEASTFRIRLGLPQTPTGDWGVLELDPFRPLVPVGIRIQSGLGPPEAVINGYVTHQEAVYGDEPGGSYLEVSGMDVTYVMNLQEKVMPWPNLPDSGIAAAIFGQYAVIPEVQPTSPVITEPEGTITQRGTDIRLLRRLAARNGFDCYVQPEPLTGVDTGYFRPPQLVGIPQGVLNVNLGTDTNTTGFRVRYEMTRPTAAVAAAVDPLTKSPQPAVAPVSARIPMGAEPTLLRIVPPPAVRPAETGLSRAGDLQRSIQAGVDRSSWAVMAEGHVGPDVPMLRPGRPVNIRGAGRVFNGSYHVTRVVHTIGPAGYRQRFEARRNAVTMTGAELYAIP
jgi:hypothetical protein